MNKEETPKYDPENLQKAIKKASVNWNKIADVEEWLDQVRGREPENNDLQAKAKEMIEDFLGIPIEPDMKGSIRLERAKTNAIKCCEWNIKYLDSIFESGIIPDQLHDSETLYIESLIQTIKNYQL